MYFKQHHLYVFSYTAWLPDYLWWGRGGRHLTLFNICDNFPKSSLGYTTKEWLSSKNAMKAVYKTCRRNATLLSGYFSYGLRVTTRTTWSHCWATRRPVLCWQEIYNADACLQYQDFVASLITSRLVNCESQMSIGWPAQYLHKS